MRCSNPSSGRASCPRVGRGRSGPTAASVARRAWQSATSPWREIDGRVRDLLRQRRQLWDRTWLCRRSEQETASWSRRRSWAACSARALHEGSLAALPHSSRSLRAVPLGSSRAHLFFSRPPGCRAFSWPRRGFPLPAIKKARRPFRLVGSLSIFPIETLLALRGAELPSWWGVLQLS